MGFVSTGGTIIDPANNPVATTLISRPFGINTYTGLTAAYEVIYKSQPNVRTVVDFLARNMAQLNLKLYRRVSDTERRHERDHGLEVLLRHPHPRVSRYVFMRDLYSDLGIFDNFVALKILAPQSGRRAMLRIPPQYVTPLGSNWLLPDGYRITLGGREVDLPWERFVHLRGYNPIDSRWGLSPIETLRRLLSEDAAAGEAREQLWRNGARATGIISRPQDAPQWKSGARERFRQEWADFYTGTGPDAGGTPILEDGMTFNKIAMDWAELEYLGARKLTRAEVAAAYHVDPTQVGIMDSANLADVQAAHVRLYTDTLTPLSVFGEEELALQLLPDFEAGFAAADELYLEYDLEEKLRGDFATEAEAASRAVGAPYLTRNEYRARRNLPPVPGGDELITPLNVTTGGRASPADTAPGTPGLGQAARRKAITAAKATTPDSAANLPAELEPWVAQHADALDAFVTRQRASVMAKLGAGSTPIEAFGVDAVGRMARWDGELSDDLAGLALSLSPDAAAPIAEAFGLEYDLEVATAWLVNNARIAAETFNERTLAAVNDLYPAPLTSSQAETLGYDPGVPVLEDAFVAAAGARAASLALDRVGAVGNFSRHEAARQAGASTKTWRVRSAHPRASHAALDGVTIGVSERFDNGGLWPHDPALSPEEAGGCTCVVDFTEAPASA